MFIDLQSIFYAVTRNPAEAAGVASSWVALAYLAITVHRLTDRSRTRWSLIWAYPLRWLVWSYLLMGIAVSFRMNGSLVVTRGDLAQQMEAPLQLLVASALSSLITGFIWPLSWILLATWFSNVPQGAAIHKEYGGMLIVAGTLSVVFSAWSRRWLAASDSTSHG